jgi:hypothetical protein
MDLSFFGIVNNINKLKKNNEKFNGDNLSTVEVFLIIISLVIGLGLLIWTIYVLATFKLPKEILILSIVLLFLTGPVIPLVLAYVFRNKQL